MNKTVKKKIHRQLIKFQNKLGKKIGKVTWMEWKAENGHK